MNYWDWKDTRDRALWTAAEALLATLIVFLVALAAAWVDSGAFVVPAVAVVTLASGAVSAVAAGLTVLKEYARHRRDLKAKIAAGEVWSDGNF